MKPAPDSDRPDEQFDEAAHGAGEAAKTRSVPVLTRALHMLEVIAASRNGIALPEIARKLNMPKSSAHCILLTLLRQGYLTRSEHSRRYVFSSKLLRLAHQAVHGLRLREAAILVLRQLSLNTGLSVHMAILEWPEAVLIAKVDPPGAPLLSTWLGRRMELHCTGVGKALMASLDEQELRDRLKRLAFSRHNDNTITSNRRLLQEAVSTKAKGYALDDEEDEVGFRCIGVPVQARHGATVAAISLAGSVSQVTNENMMRLVETLKQAAEAITTLLSENQPAAQE